MFLCPVFNKKIKMRRWKTKFFKVADIKGVFQKRIQGDDLSKDGDPKGTYQAKAGCNTKDTCLHEAQPWRSRWSDLLVTKAPRGIFKIFFINVSNPGDKAFDLSQGCRRIKEL